jgi:ketosteroid isomerase-like protein
MTDQIAAIHAHRAESNAAIAARDADAVVALMLANVTVAVAGGPTLTGRAASRDAFAVQFAERGFKGYVRTPTEVVVHDGGIAASERGQWAGTWQHGLRREEMRGIYTAAWVLDDGRWMIASEAYVQAPGR